MRRLLALGVFLALIGASLPTMFAQGTLTPTPKFTAFDNNGLIIAAGKLCTYAAGTTTALATYNDPDLAVVHANTNPVVMDSAGRATIYLAATSYKFILYSGGTALTCDGTQLWSQDNITSVPVSAGVTSQTGTAGETITAGSVAYLSDGSGAKVAGLWYNADQANAYSSTLNPIGMTTAAVASGSTGTFILAGSITGLTSLTIGAAYYVGTAGAMTTIVPTTNLHLLGTANTATSLVLSAPPFLTSLTRVNQGGTGLQTLTANNVLLGQGTNAVSFVAPGSYGNVLTSNGTTWMTSLTPYAHTVTTSANPSGTISNVGVMMGLAGTITPTASGTVLICAAGRATNNTNADGGAMQIRFGTGTAPTNGAALTGTAIGASPAFLVPDAINPANALFPIASCAHTTGLSPNIPVWYDVSLTATVGGTATLTSMVMSADELP